MFINFEKWHGCLNDFIVVWLTKAEESFALASLKRQAHRLCSKQGDGIGADGILVLHVQDRRDLTPTALTVINRDGSVAANCGNGLRCAALSVYRRQQAEGPLHGEALQSLSLLLAGDEKVCTFLPSGGDKLPLVAVAMGQALLNKAVAWYDEARAAAKAVSQSLGQAMLARAEVFACELGNPHLVFFVEELPEGLIARLGPALQTAPLADGINVHLVVSREPKRDDQNQAQAALGSAHLSEVHTAQVWERGVGLTPACGSGAAAIAASALHAGLANRHEWMAIAMPGGRLYARQTSADAPVVLAGPADFVFQGQFEL